jgi:diguanylate cyclase (GGDEF)-like protein
MVAFGIIINHSSISPVALSYTCPMVLSRPDSLAGPWIPIEDPRGSSLSRMLAGWWHTPVEYDAQVAYFSTHGLMRLNKVLIGSGVMMVAVITTIIQFSPAGPGAAPSRIVAAAFSVGAAAWALRWWFGGWPNRMTSRAFVVYVDVSMAIFALVNTNASVVGFAPTVLVLLSFYLVFYAGAKLLLLHSVWILITVLLLSVNAAFDAGGDVALGIVKLIAGASLAFAPVGIQFGIWTLQNEANESLRDPLTGLLNRRGMRLHLRNLLSGRAPGDDHIVVILADLDRFKDINEVHGHGVGDEVLIRSARRIQLATGPHSVVARVGGEEFLVAAVLPAEDCAWAAELVCAAVCSDTDLVPVTGSIGVTSTPVAAFDAGTATATLVWESLLDSADQAMFQAKRAGGNQSVYVPTG